MPGQHTHYTLRSFFPPTTNLRIFLLRENKHVQSLTATLLNRSTRAAHVQPIG